MRHGHDEDNKISNTTHPEYDAMLPLWDKYGLTFQGGTDFIDAYLRKFSHREMEICSVGVPMFTEDRNQRMWRPFLANKHYIPVTPETFIDVFNYYDKHYDEALEIGRNGHDYFMQNHGQAGLQVIFKEIVDKIINL